MTSTPGPGASIPATPPPPKPGGRLTEWVRRRPKIAFWLTLSVALIAGVGIGVAGTTNQAEVDRLSTELADMRGQLDAAHAERDATAEERDAANDRIAELTAEGEVPDLTGGTVEEAEALVEDYEWKLKTGKRASDEEPGTVISQRPREGTTLKSGRSITLVVAKARPKEWQTIFSFSGSGSRKSNEFEIPDGKVRIQYSFSGGTNAILHLNVPDDELGGELLLNEIGNFSDTTRVYGHAGTRYLEADGGTWSIEVQAYK